MLGTEILQGVVGAKHRGITGVVGARYRAITGVLGARYRGITGVVGARYIQSGQKVFVPYDKYNFFIHNF